VICVITTTSMVTATLIQVPSEYLTIQAGINSAAAGDTVLVADGTYTGDGNRDIDFNGKPILVTSSPTSRSIWPLMQHDLKRSGYTSIAGPSSADSVLTFSMGDASTNGSAIASDGTVYAASWDGKLYALSPDLSIVFWSFPTGGQIRRGPAIGPDGTIYMGSLDSTLYAINPDGSEKWRFKTSHEVWSYPAPTEDAVYFGSVDRYMYAVNPHDGSELWRFGPLGDWPGDGVAIMDDGTLVFGSWDGKAYAVWPDGTERWIFTTDGPVRSLPMIGENGQIYIASIDGNVYSLNGEGQVQWYFSADSSVSGPMAYDPSGNIYFGSWAGSFYSVDPTGQENWRWREAEPGNNLLSGAIVDSRGRVYFGSETGYMYCLNKFGQLVWTFHREQPDGGFCSVNSNGTIYFGSDAPILYAIRRSLVTVEVIPDATIVPRGGELGYTVEVANNSGEDQTFEYWSDVYLWTGEPYKKNPVFGPKRVTIKAGKTKSGHLSHKVPNNAPLKTYTLCARIGCHPDDIWDEDCFEFTVVEGPEPCEIPNASFEEGDLGQFPPGWNKETECIGEGATCVHEAWTANTHYFHGSRSLYMHSRVVDPGVVGSYNSITWAWTADWIICPNATSVKFYMRDIVSTHSVSWGWANNISLCITDGENSACIEVCRDSEYEHYNDYDDIETGADGASWLMYNKEIPAHIDKTHMKIGIRDDTCTWTWYGYYSDLKFYVDMVELISSLGLSHKATDWEVIESTF
jgi:outer membrane protein assembly factor BamB